MKLPRIKNTDIAKALGISTASVSLSLNDKPGVSEDTRQKVLDYVRQYEQEQILGLKQKLELPDKKGLILLSVFKNYEDFNSSYYSIIENNIRQEINSTEYGFMSIHRILNQRGNSISEHIEELKKYSAIGLIIIATELSKKNLGLFSSLDIPIVLVDSSFEFENIDAVEINNQATIYRVVNYAYNLGHKDIGFLQGELQIQNFNHRLDGFYKGVRELDLLK